MKSNLEVLPSVEPLEDEEGPGKLNSEGNLDDSDYESAEVGNWEDKMEDGSFQAFQALFEEIENLQVTTPVDTVKRNVVVLVNCMTVLREVAADIRMMHRQVLRIINKKVTR